MNHRFRSRLDVADFCTVNRRTLLRGLGATALVTAAGGLFRGGVCASPVFAASPFSLGVAAGDPAPDGFVIWTKLAPPPLERSGGMPPESGGGRLGRRPPRPHAHGGAKGYGARPSRARPRCPCRGQRT